jgi:hypothetical protein
MSLRHRSAVPICAVLLASCGHHSEMPRVATAEEASAIITPLIPSITSARTCVGRQLRPPLEDQRRNAKFESTLHRARSWFERQLFGDEQTRSNWSQSQNGKMLPLRRDDARHLDRLLRQATTAQLSDRMSGLALPGVTTCTDRDEKTEVFAKPPVYRFYYSQPVVVGNVAFVEEGGVCGGLCGSGSLKALIKHGKTWSVVAEQMTWIS